MMLQYTIQATGVTEPITPTQRDGIANGIYFQNATLQNNGTHDMRVGNDSTVSATKGLKLTATGSFTDILPINYAGTLNDWYVNGTANDVLDILVNE